jgi:Uma2 family endonuclease
VRHFGRQAGDTVIVRCQNPLRLDDLNQPEPDVAVLRPRDDMYTTAHPGAADALLVVEVADTSLAYDIGVKVPLYARHGIPEVWVVDAATRRTTVFRGLVGGRYADETQVESNGALSCDAVTTAAGGRLEIVLTRLLPPLA